MKPSQLKQALKYAAVKQQRPVFIWSAPGVGKSEIVAQLAKELKMQLVDKRLSQSDPSELKGYPWPNQETKTMVFMRDDELPTKGKGILFLDEINLAPQATQAAAYQLILNRRIGTYELPPGWVVIAAGNRTSDRSGVHALSAALANRFVHIDLHADVEDWVDWALENNISDATRGYLRYRPGNLSTDKIEPGVRAYPTPRTWAFASDILKSNLPAAVELELLRGTVGDAAGELTAFMRVYKDLPTVDEVLMNPDKAALPNELSAKYAISTSLAAKASRDNFDVVMQYVNRLPTEFQVVFMRDSARRDDGVQKAQSYMKWCVKNHEVMT